MRVRTGRFEKLGTGKLGQAQSVEVGYGQESVHAQGAGVPPPPKVASDAQRFVLAGTQPAQRAVGRRPASPVLELHGSHPMPQPLVQPLHHRGRLRQPEVRLPAWHIDPQIGNDLFHAATPAAARELAHALAQHVQRLTRNRQLGATLGRAEAVAQELAPPHRCHRRLRLVDLQLELGVADSQRLQHPLACPAALDIDVAVVGVTHEPVAPAFQLPIHFVQQHVGQQRAQRPALRRALHPLAANPVRHDARLQVAPDQPQLRLVRDALGQPVHQDVVVDAVKELLQVHVHHRPAARLHVLLRCQHRAMRASPRPEAVAMLAERGGNQWLQHLQQGLLDQPVHHGRYPQLARATTGFGYAHTAHWRGPVAAVEQCRPYGHPPGLEVVARLLHRASIDAGAALVGLDAFPRRSHVLSGQGLPEQVHGPGARLFASRRRCLLMLEFGLWLHLCPRSGTRRLRQLSSDTFKRHDS